MQRTYLEMSMIATIREHLVKVKEHFPDSGHPDGEDLLIADIINQMRVNGLDTALGNLAESFVLGEENRIGVRAVVAAYQVPADTDKPIVIKLEADNNRLTSVQMAMLKGEACDLSGVQGELFAASDLGIHMAPTMDLLDEAV